ncbi:MAG: glycerol acyltransferase [Chlorobi bacterium]|nr:glycerol acyltransferase [Chlorobiota bacterium]
MTKKEVHNNDKLIDLNNVFKSKNPRLYKYFPKFIISILKRIIHQDAINDFINRNRHKHGLDFARATADEFLKDYNSYGLDEIPDGRYIFASNHPLGGLDGMVFLTLVGERFPNVLFPVNDILLNIDNMKDHFVPINKHGSQGREAAKKLEDAYASDNQILMFPAGLVSRKINGKITDLEWKRNFIKKAIKHKRDIVPVHITGRNSNFFYNLANLRKKLGIKANIEMLFLPDEMFKTKSKHITVRFGKPVKWEELNNGDKPEKWAQKIKELSYNLAKNN